MNQHFHLYGSGTVQRKNFHAFVVWTACLLITNPRLLQFSHYWKAQARLTCHFLVSAWNRFFCFFFLTGAGTEKWKEGVRSSAHCACLAIPYTLACFLLAFQQGAVPNFSPSQTGWGGRRSFPGSVSQGRPISDFMAKGAEVVFVQGYLYQKGKAGGSLPTFGLYKRF